MRVAILSDIHSNLQALTRAFSIIDHSAIDSVYCLGDIVGYGGNPNECADLVRERCTASVLGNHDLAALDTSTAYYFTKPGRAAALWTNKILTDANVQYLSALPRVLHLDQFSLAHSGPHEPEEWEYVLSLPVARKQFEAFTTPVCFIGHTHVPALCGENLRTFTFKKEMRFLINVGSVGQPRDGNPHLSFGIFDTDAWTYKNIRSEYDIDGASKAILAAGLPSVLSSRLFLGQ